MRKLFIPIIMASTPVFAMNFGDFWGNKDVSVPANATYEIPKKDTRLVQDPFWGSRTDVSYVFSNGKRMSSNEYEMYIRDKEDEKKRKEAEKQTFDKSYFGKIAGAMGVSYDNSSSSPQYSSTGGLMGNVFSNMFNTGSNAATSVWNFGSSIYSAAADKVNSALKSVGVDSSVINKINDFVRNSPSIVKDIVKQQMTPENIAAALLSASGLIGVPGPIVALVAKYAVPIIMKELGI